MRVLCAGLDHVAHLWGGGDGVRNGDNLDPSHPFVLCFPYSFVNLCQRVKKVSRCLFLDIGSRLSQGLLVDFFEIGSD